MNYDEVIGQNTALHLDLIRTKDVDGERYLNLTDLAVIVASIAAVVEENMAATDDLPFEDPRATWAFGQGQVTAMFTSTFGALLDAATLETLTAEDFQ